MSGFVKRERAIKTVNPAGGVNPANVPNVGQYGWTNYDSAVINQLIGYVDVASASAVAARESAEYVYNTLSEVEAFATFITDGLADFEPKYQDFLVKYPDFERIYNNTVSMHEVIVLYRDEMIKLAAEVYNDSVNAKSWAYISFIVYLDSRNQLTDAGDWNATSGALPAVPATNSIWSVKTSGQVDVDFGGFIWNEGDHLTYTLREKGFNQVKQSFYTFNSKSVNLMDTIAEMQREISELKEMMNEHVL